MGPGQGLVTRSQSWPKFSLVHINPTFSLKILFKNRVYYVKLNHILECFYRIKKYAIFAKINRIFFCLLKGGVLDVVSDSVSSARFPLPARYQAGKRRSTTAMLMSLELLFFFLTFQMICFLQSNVIT